MYEHLDKNKQYLEEYLRIQQNIIDETQKSLMEKLKAMAERNEVIYAEKETAKEEIERLKRESRRRVGISVEIFERALPTEN